MIKKNIHVWTKNGYEELTWLAWLMFDNNSLHREDGPAVEHASGSKEWFLRGKSHREDGPAIEYANGTKRWYLNGNMLPKKEVESWLNENNINLKTTDGKMAFKLRWY